MDRAAQELLDKRRLRATRALSRAHRSALGQFFTPTAVAEFLASLFAPIPTSHPREVHLLDPGAGIGSLTAAVAHHFAPSPIAATCYELEAAFQADLAETCGGLVNLTAQLEQKDFIVDAVELVLSGKGPRYTHVVLNPPYLKIKSASLHRQLARRVGLETSNLYACFLGCAIALCRPGAEVVGILPRSFMNGLYFKRFRAWLLARVALTHIHIFDRRDRAFFDDKVLQENVILRMVVGARQDRVWISTSHDPRFSDLRRRQCDFSEVVLPGDEDRFFHVPPIAAASAPLPGVPLRELGLDVCTGPVVDFRLRPHLRRQPEADTVPLLYAAHFPNGQLVWPRQGHRADAIVRNAATERWLLPRGCYVLLRRLTSKEERRRVVAYLLEEGALPGDRLGIENHLNVIHMDRHGLPLQVARGLVYYVKTQYNRSQRLYPMGT